MEREDDIVIFGRYEDPIEAQIVKGVLETNGIIAGVMEENISRGLMMSPTCVMVMRRDLQRAQEVLESAAEE
ncbi:MAG: DUF2007 domain-containing protein [Bacteroidales bacterium]|nr:DUF2007 domain-containing protein [Candidatus Sodaliphilus fimicaballi]